MEIPDFVDQFLKLKEKDLEQKIWEIWVAKFPFMSKEDYVSYEEMLNTARQSETVEGETINGSYVDQIFF